MFLDPPTLSDAESWSSDFKDFLYQCLQKDPEKRPTAKTLLEHRFVTQAQPNSCLFDAIKETLDIIKQSGGREEALGLNDDSEEESDSETAKSEQDGGAGISFAFVLVGFDF